MAHFPARPTTFAPALCLLAIAATAGCSVKKFAIYKLGDSLANSDTSYAADDDLELVGQALPFSLKLVDRDAVDHLHPTLTTSLPRWFGY